MAGVGVGVTVGFGVAAGSGVTVGVGTGVEVGAGVTVGVGTGVEVGSGVTVGVGTGVWVGSGVAVGVVSGVKAGSEVAEGSDDAVTGVEGLFAGCEHATIPTLTKQISAGRIRLCKKYLCFFIVGISVSSVLIVSLYLIFSGNTTRKSVITRKEIGNIRAVRVRICYTIRWKLNSAKEMQVVE